MTPWTAFDQFKTERPWFVYGTIGLAAASGVVIAVMTIWGDLATRTPKLWLVPFSFLLVLGVVHELWIFGDSQGSPRSGHNR